jgi:hypothetical protein
MLFVLATLPSAIIVNAWVNEAATFALFFEVISFIVFYKLISSEEQKLSVRSIVLSILLILLIIFADKAKVTAKIIPCIFLSYLFFTKNKKPLIFITVAISLIAIFPFGFLKEGSSGHSYLQVAYVIKLLTNFCAQIWPLFVYVLLVGIFARHNINFQNEFVLFSSLWFFFEILFCFIYPSSEIRYLFSSLAAAILFLSNLVSRIFINLTQDKLSKIAKDSFIVILIFMLSLNIFWSYNFRGSFASIFIIVDKEINFINRFYKNSLCLYSEYTLPYYTRHTTNQYVNSNAKYVSQYGDIVSTEPQGARVLNPEKYDNIIILDSTGVDKAPTKIFNGVIKDSLYDSFQSHVGFKIHSVSVYSTSIGEVIDYPQVRSIAIYRVK